MSSLILFNDLEDGVNSRLTKGYSKLGRVAITSVERKVIKTDL